VIDRGPVRGGVVGAGDDRGDPSGGDVIGPARQQRRDPQCGSWFDEHAVLTTFDQDENVLAALRAGADGFLGKGAGPAELTAAIVRVSAGGHALSEAAVDAVVGHLADATAAPTDPAVAALFDRLTPREREIVEAVVRGLDKDDIAAMLFLSPFT
jgi:DNA-binding NarL/FixJ family response regulator